MRSFRFRTCVTAAAVALVVGMVQMGPASAATITSAVSAGGTTSCALTSTGGVKCWGDNTDGQLGDGTNNNSTVPVDVSGLTSGVAAVSAGGTSFACALTTAGGAKCWGNDDNGQLGDGTNTNSNVPVDVSGLTSGVASISAGNSGACALSNSGGDTCWGSNAYGELGDGTQNDSNVPIDVSGLTSGVAAISAGSTDNCAVTTAGGAKCWGYNGAGELGNGTNTDSFVPVDVTGLTSGVAQISVGNGATCAVTTSGGAKCWGSNEIGEVGDGTFHFGNNLPVDVSGLTSGVASISAGSDNTCALTTAGGAKCWGSGVNGGLGDDISHNTNVPGDVSFLTSGVASISTGEGDHSCAVTTTGSAECWGDNGDYNNGGDLGDGSTINRFTPVSVVGLTVSGPVPKISTMPKKTTPGQTIAITGTDLTGVSAVTFNGVSSTSFSQTGETVHALVPSGATTGHVVITAADGFATSKKTLKVIPTMGSASLSEISTGTLFACALTTSGGVKCWGHNDEGELGNGTNTDSNIPVNVVGLESGVASISAGQEEACAVMTSGAAKCWGDNTDGGLGDGTTTNSNVPVGVSGLSSGVGSISVGGGQTCAVTTAGGAKCWGFNGFGELGDGTNAAFRNVPVDVVGLTTGVASISAGGLQTCAVTTAGGAKCWGRNNDGQLGDGTNLDSGLPVDVSGLTSGVASISSGWLHTCVVTTSGGAKCWGNNPLGGLGNGTITDTNAPVDVSGLTSGVASISAGTAYTCAVTTSGGATCWGNSFNGELGNGTFTFSEVPSDVSGLTSGVASISTGDTSTCARTGDGSAKCWGANDEGQLGDAVNGQRNVPASVVGLTAGAKVPQITKLPATGGLGSTITIKGKNLTNVISISFDGASAGTYSGSGKKLRVQVPFEASTGKVTIVTLGGIAVSVGTFTVV